MSTHNVKMDRGDHFRKYNSIVRMGHRDSHGVLQQGDMISVWEKLDGSNASFKLVGDEILAFSRNLPLDESNNLNGFWQWTQTLDKSKFERNVTYYGEWLVPHKVDYGENARQFYLFDVWQPQNFGMNGNDPYEYADTWEVAFAAEELGVNLAPLLYVGPYKGYEHLKAMVGRSVLAVDPLKGEGIVIKNHKYRSKHGAVVWLKMVSEAFAEVQKVKKPRDPAKDTEAMRLAREFTTQARVEKAVEHLIDIRQIDETMLDLTCMGILIPQVVNQVQYDILVEEAPDDIDMEFAKEVKKPLGKLVPPLLRKIIEARSMEAIE